MKYLIPLTCFILLSCSEESWTKKEQDTFYQNCRVEGGSIEYCDCYKDAVMQNYPIAEDAEDIDFETKIELANQCN